MDETEKKQQNLQQTPEHFKKVIQCCHCYQKAEVEWDDTGAGIQLIRCPYCGKVMWEYLPKSNMPKE